MLLDTFAKIKEAFGISFNHYPSGVNCSHIQSNMAIAVIEHGKLHLYS